MLYIHNPLITFQSSKQTKPQFSLKMASTRPLVVFLVCVGIFTICNAQDLSLDHYKKTCPSVEAVVKEETGRIIAAAPTLAAPLLRMHFHDCFVRVPFFIYVFNLFLDD